MWNVRVETIFSSENLTLTSLLSFLSPSHMVAPERILVNISFPFNINTNTNSQESFTDMAINIEVNTPRG